MLRGQQYPDSGQFLTSLAAKYMELRIEIKLHSIHAFEACERLESGWKRAVVVSMFQAQEGGRSPVS